MATKQEIEELAKKLSIDNTGSDSLWEMFLIEAYSLYYPVPEK